MNIFKNINAVLKPREKGLSVVMKNKKEFFLDLTNLSGVDRLISILKKYREWQEGGLGGLQTEGFLVPQSLEELARLYKESCRTDIAEEATSVIWQGIAKYNNEVQGASFLHFREAFGRYHYVYRHPTEPRFSAIKAEKAWKELLKRVFPENFGPEVPDPECPGTDIHILNLKDVLYDMDVFGIKAVLGGMRYFRVPRSTLENRAFQTSNGCLVKTGKILQHVTNAEELGGDKLSVISGHVQDALRVGVAKIDSVRVSENVGEIYRMGGNFTSCMRKLGENDSPERDSFQIYKDLGAKVAYMTAPRKNFQGLPIIENGKMAMWLIARAILWDRVALIKSGEIVREVKLMDTIYRNGADEQASMVKWARQHGYAYKKAECSYSCCRFTFGPDREDEDFSLEEFDDARVYRIDDRTWERGMYERVPWVDLFCHVVADENYAGFRQRSVASCLHNQDGRGGFLTDIIKCQFCNTHLISATDEEDWHEREGTWTCPSCYDTEWVMCSNEDCCEEGPMTDFEEVNDRWFCPSCVNELYTTCDACGTRVDREEASYNTDGVPFCEECYSERYTYCARCDEETHIENSTYIEGLGDVCNYCIEHYYVQCDLCGNFVESSDEVNITKNHEGVVYNDTMTLCQDCQSEKEVKECIECKYTWDALHPESVAIGDPMCTDCFKTNYHRCSICGDWTPLDEWKENGGLCDSCWHMSY